MASWSRSGTRWTPAEKRVVLALLAVAVVAGCKKAAAVFLDLPVEPARDTQVQPAPAVGAGAPAQGREAQDTVRPRPAIEAVFDPDSALAMLPRDRAGNVDWVAALRDGIIRPRWSMPGEALPSGASGFGFDFLLKGPAPMFDAYFPHSRHVELLSCQSCHPRIFPYRNAPITMDAINRGEACGQCHGKVAFPASTCERCHQKMSMPEGRATPALLGDLTFTRRGDSGAAGAFPPAQFSHWVHRVRYRCAACHPSPFEARAGANAITMTEMQKGRQCGRCHDGRAAFPLAECNRCHVPARSREGS